MENYRERDAERLPKLLDGEEHKGPLHICADCSGESVQPVRDESAELEGDEERYYVQLHCPDCDGSFAGVFGIDQMLALEERINDDLAEMGWEEMAAENALRRAEVEQFVDALYVDEILPKDFN